MMKAIGLDKVRDEVKRLYIESCYYINDDMLDALKKAIDDEESPVGKEILNTIIENDEIAKREKMPMCQDTGLTVVIIELGEEVQLEGEGNLYKAINEGVAQAAKDGYLRRSVVGDPLHDRKNTGDNTPAMIHVDIVPGSNMKIMVAAKGTGSENMSALKMMKPSDGAEGVKKFVVDTVRSAGPNPCPPIVVGVGIGGSFDRVAFLAKRSLFRGLNQKNPDPFYAKLEDEILEAINRTGVGPQGLGGRTTAVAVHIETWPCHIGALPVAVNIDCHAHRHKEVVI
jgi:fumarate hydratase subunit alpha